MKKMQFPLFVLVMSALFSFSAIAQQKTVQQAPAQANRDAAQAASPKDEWTKNYNSLKPKLDSYLSKAKTEGTNHPDFAREVKTFDDMMKDFKGKIDKFDAASQSEKEHYAETMKSYFERIKVQEGKVKAAYDQLKPAGNNAQKQAAPQR